MGVGSCLMIKVKVYEVNYLEQESGALIFFNLVAWETSPLLLMASPLGLALSPGRTASDTTCWNRVPSCNIKKVEIVLM